LTARSVDIDLHNTRQCSYFESAPKAGMQPQGSRYLARQLDELMEFAHIRSGDRVLEFGCGMGRYTLPLAEAGVRVEGLDISRPLLDRLKDFARDHVEIPVHAGDVVDPPASVAPPYDAVIGLFALHHVHDIGACVESMAALVRPGGRVAFLEPNPYCPLYYLQMAGRRDMTWEGDGGLVRMRPGVIADAMKGAGLRGFQSRRFGFAPPAVANRPRGAALEAALESLSALEPVRAFGLFCAERA